MRRALLASILLLSAGCAYDNDAPTQPSAAVPTPSTPSAPARVSLQAQAGVGSSATQAFITASVIDAYGLVVPYVSVSFSTSLGTLNPTTSVTDLGGVARTTLTAPRAATVTAHVASVSATTVAAISADLSVSMSVAAQGTTGVTLPFSAFAIGATAPATYTWNFGDGATTTTTTGSTSHAYGRPGTLTASVHIVDAIGRVGDASQSITVSDLVVVTPTPTPTPAAAALSANVNCTPATHGAVTPCNLSASYGSTALLSTAITSVTWDYGDGVTATIANSPLASHNYAQAGSYSVVANVTATTTDGAKTVSISKTLTIP